MSIDNLSTKPQCLARRQSGADGNLENITALHTAFTAPMKGPSAKARFAKGVNAVSKIIACAGIANAAASPFGVVNAAGKRNPRNVRRYASTPEQETLNNPMERNGLESLSWSCIVRCGLIRFILLPARSPLAFRGRMTKGSKGPAAGVKPSRQTGRWRSNVTYKHNTITRGVRDRLKQKLRPCRC